MWHPTYCLNEGKADCADQTGTSDSSIHDSVLYDNPEQGKVVAELFVDDELQPIPLVVASAHADYAFTPGQARVFAQAILVAADEAEYAATEWRARPTQPGMILGM